MGKSLIFWAVNHDTMGSNSAETISSFLILMLLTFLLTLQTLNTVVSFPSVLLFLQPSSHKLAMEHSMKIICRWAIECYKYIEEQETRACFVPFKDIHLNMKENNILYREFEPVSSTPQSNSYTIELHIYRYRARSI